MKQYCYYKDVEQNGGVFMEMKEFGIYFSEIRKKSGFRSQRELADKTGVSHSTINRLEGGTHKVSPDTLKILSNHLNVSYEILMMKSGYIDEDDEQMDVDWPDGVKVLRRANEELTPKEKKKMLRLIEDYFLNDEDDS
jgi:transcriptional regulator with XRE-family HTH domain